MRRHSPAAHRNRGPILDVLREELPTEGTVLEIASGSGEHVIFFAAALPSLAWAPSDVDPTALASIEAYRRDRALPNLHAALALDATSDWPIAKADAVLSINMIHIAPWAAAIGLVRNAARVLASGAPLVLYGPFLHAAARSPLLAGLATAPSNLEFDQSLRDRDPAWGVREAQDVVDLAAAHGLDLARRVDMPANNHTLVFRRR